jgi:hypothetical protein
MSELYLNSLDASRLTGFPVHVLESLAAYNLVRIAVIDGALYYDAKDLLKVRAILNHFDVEVTPCQR